MSQSPPLLILPFQRGPANPSPTTGPPTAPRSQHPTARVPGPQAKIIVGNHTTLMDVFWMMYWFMPSAVAKASVAKYPIIGNLCRLLGVIFVHRDDPDSRHKTAEAIMVRTKCEGARPLLIFPEGTCTNGTCLIMFKVGAFRPGVPVQPVVMQVGCRAEGGLTPSVTTQRAPPRVECGAEARAPLLGRGLVSG